MMSPWERRRRPQDTAPRDIYARTRRATRGAPHVARKWHLLLLLVLRRSLGLVPALSQCFLVLVVGELVVGHPGERHVIDRTLAKPGPIRGVRVELVPRRIVVPGDDVQGRTGGQQRL